MIYFKKYRAMYEKFLALKYAVFIMAAILLVDNLNVANKIVLSRYKIVIGILVVIFIILEVSKFTGAFKLKIVNQIDLGLAVSFITSLSLSIIYKFILVEVTYKLYICSALIVIFTILLIIRIGLINRANENSNIESNVYGLKDLYEGKIVQNNKLIFINEEEESYDLLKRSYFIKTVYDAIVNCNPKKDLL